MKSIRGIFKHIITDNTLVIMLIVFAMLGSFGPLVIKKYNLSLLGLYLGIPMLFAAIIWLVIRTKEIVTVNISENLHKLSILMFFWFYLFSILILHYFPVRTLSYYALIAGMGVLILIQILFATELSKKQINMTLLQTVLLFLNIIWGVTLKYYFFVGRTDVFFHSWLIQNLLDTGHINLTFDNYEAFPLWHILSSYIYQIMNYSIMPVKIMFITNGLIYGCLVLTIYLVASKILNSRIALLSALLMCFNTDAIFYGMYSIPRSVVIFLEGLLIVLLMQPKTHFNIVLRILIIIGLIMYHTASMPFIILILALFYMLEGVHDVGKAERPVNLNFLLLIFVTTLTYWMYPGVKVFNSVAQNLLSQAPTGILTKSIVITPLQELFNYLQYSPLLLFVILGTMWGLRSTKLKGVARIFLMMGLLLVPVTFPGPALLLNKLAGDFNFARFAEYSFIFISIAGATGLYILFYKLKTKYKISVIILFFLMAFLAVSNDFTASDSPLIKRPFYTFYYSEEENISIKRVAQISEGYLMSDYISCRYLESSALADKSHVLEVDSKRQEFLKGSREDIIFLRKDELIKRPLKLFTSPNGKFIFKPTIGENLDYYYQDSSLWNTLENYNTIYDSGGVKAFQ
jgi:hypothetical protein